MWGFLDRVRFWVSRKLPAQEVDDVVDEVIESAIKSSFDAKETGQFVAWLRRMRSVASPIFSMPGREGPRRPRSPRSTRARRTSGG